MEKSYFILLFDSHITKNLENITNIQTTTQKFQILASYQR